MLAERKRTMFAAPRKTAWTAIAISVGIHAAGFAALVAWSTIVVNSHVQFTGYEQVIQWTPTLDQPQWIADTITLEFFPADPLVVVEPTEVRIGTHRYIHVPTIALSADNFLLDLAAEPRSQLLELTTLSDGLDTTKQSAQKNPTIPSYQTNLKMSEIAVVEPSSSISSVTSNRESRAEFPPDLSQNVPPTYPAHAILNGWEGTVLLRIWIDEAGRVTKVKVARSSGYRILDGAAAITVGQWKAIPATHSGKPFATVELLPVRFTLSQE